METVTISDKEHPMEGRVYETFEGEDGAEEFFVLITTGGAERLSHTTDLQLIINSSEWTDYEDDMWSMALSAFAPLSKNLKHLHIVIKGPFLFTRFNYVKPIVYEQVPFGHLRQESKNDGDNSTDAPLSGAKPQAGRTKRLLEEDPGKDGKIVEYKRRAVSPTKVDLHISADKAIISALFSLHKPISRVTIEGYMELGLRRQLITTLNPRWNYSTHCRAQLGYDTVAAKDAGEREELCIGTGTDLVKMNTRSPQGDEHLPDFNMGRGIVPGWPMPTNASQRQVYGWKGAAIHAWKGPPVRRSSEAQE